MVWIWFVLFIIAVIVATYYFSVFIAEKEKNKEYEENKKQLLLETNNNVHLMEENKNLKEKEKELIKLKIEIASIEKEKEHLQKEKEHIENLQKDLLNSSKLEFEKIANNLLKTTKDELTNTNKKELKNVVEPFEKNIKSFEETIQNQTKEFSQTKGSLENELKNIINQGNQLKEQTNNLIDMFKTDSKAKGDFGESILQTILENSNLQENVNYFSQKQEKGKRTDFQILLPGDKWVVIDSKVPLTAYMNYCNSKTEEDKNKYLDEHIEAINGFIKNLSSKKYTERFIDKGKSISPDFTLMFIYPEEAYISALRHKPTLTTDAWKKEIAIVSATSLIHTIRIIEKLWDVQRQVENHEKIVSIAKNFKTRILSFIENMAKVSGNIETLNTNFNKFSNTVKGDRGLVNLLKELSDYGINCEKELEPDLDKIREIKMSNSTITDNK
jgi:DNA recombination protein RmuC